MATATTQTEAVQHVQVVEIENAAGHRYWTTPMTESDVKLFLAENKIDGISDLDCVVDCPACNS